ncbi:MAG: DUF998 domain-containing protein [Candidatus Nezhaarchaeales archaeon]
MGEAGNRVAGALMFVGAAQFALFMLIAECIYPNYNVSKNYISELGALQAPTAFMFNASIIVLGLTAIATVYFLWRRKTITNKVFLSFLALCGTGCAGVGIFPMDFQLPHAIAAILAFVFGALAAIASYKFQGAPASYFSVVLGIVSLIAFVSFVLRIDFGLGIGGIERMISYPTLLWAMMFGGYLMKE